MFRRHAFASVASVILIAMLAPSAAGAVEDGRARVIVADAVEIGARHCAEAFDDPDKIGANLSAAGARSVPLDYFSMPGRADGVVGSYSLELHGEEFGILVFPRDGCQVMVQSQAVITANTELRKLIAGTYSGRCTDAHTQLNKSRSVLLNRRFCTLDRAQEDGRVTVILTLLTLGPDIAFLVTQFTPLEPEGVEEILANQSRYFDLDVGID